MRLPLLLWLLIHVTTWNYCEAFLQGLIPVLTGALSLQGLFRVGVIYIGTAVYILSGIHSGYKRQTMHTKPEFEQIIEVLDVPEDVYQERKRNQVLTGVGNGVQPGDPSVDFVSRIEQGPNQRSQVGPLRRKGDIKLHEQQNTSRFVVTRNGSRGFTVGHGGPFRAKVHCHELRKDSLTYRKYCAHSQEKTTYSDSQVQKQVIYRSPDGGQSENLFSKFGPFRKRPSCKNLRRGSRAYGRYCDKQKPPHTDVISFMYPNYLPWKAVPATIGSLKGKEYHLRNRFFVPQALKRWFRENKHKDNN